MHWDRIQSRWRQIASHVREKWDLLTTEDCYSVNGHRERLASKIQERYGVTREEAERQVVEWQRSASESWFKKDKHHA
jgi:uncharacterized protein YjbJ (UPF0337 family)